MPATQSFIHPASAKHLKNIGLKINVPLSQGLNPSNSTKNIQEVNSLFMSGPSSPLQFKKESSEKKLNIYPIQNNKK